MFKAIKKIFNVLLDYTAMLILAMLGLCIVKLLYLASFTVVGSAIMIVIVLFASICWAFYRLFSSKKEEK